MPLGFSLFLISFGLLFRGKKFSSVVIGLGLTVLYLSSIPVTGQWLSQQLEIYPALALPVKTDAEAIVVLGAGSYVQAPEYGVDSLKKSGLERVRYAAWLHHETGLPILTTGGKTIEQNISEADIAQDILVNEFSAQVNWVENKSLSTRENAQFSCQILQREKIEKILLVTHAWHMPRAMDVFSQHCAGIIIQAAPTIFTVQSVLDRGLFVWIPTIDRLQANTLFFHELIGMAIALIF